MGLFKESTIDVSVEDLLWEHDRHNELIPERCSGCYAKQQELTGVTLKNELQDSNLDILKAKIQANREQREKEKRDIVVLANEIRRTLIPIPEVYEEAKAEFNLTRHTELCKKVDTLYHNYLVSLDSLIENPTSEESNKIFQHTIKELSVVYDDLLFEGIKPRW